MRNARVQSSLTTTTTHINISDYCDQLILMVANYYYQQSLFGLVISLWE